MPKADPHPKAAFECIITHAITRKSRGHFRVARKLFDDDMADSVLKRRRSTSPKPKEDELDPLINPATINAPKSAPKRLKRTKKMRSTAY